MPCTLKRKKSSHYVSSTSFFLPTCARQYVWIRVERKNVHIRDQPSWRGWKKAFAVQHTEVFTIKKSISSKNRSVVIPRFHCGRFYCTQHQKHALMTCWIRPVDSFCVVNLFLLNNVGMQFIEFYFYFLTDVYDSRRGVTLHLMLNRVLSCAHLSQFSMETSD